MPITNEMKARIIDLRNESGLPDKDIAQRLSLNYDTYRYVVNKGLRDGTIKKRERKWNSEIRLQVLKLRHIYSLPLLTISERLKMPYSSVYYLARYPKVPDRETKLWLRQQFNSGATYLELELKYGNKYPIDMLFYVKEYLDERN